MTWEAEEDRWREDRAALRAQQTAPLQLPCPQLGKCHGDAAMCPSCGDVSRTCELPQCATHDGVQRCGRAVATALGWRRCASLPHGSGAGCSAIQLDSWLAARRRARGEAGSSAAGLEGGG